MPVDTTVAQPSLLYLTTTLGAKMMVPLDLKRYDLATGKTTTLYSLLGSSWPDPPLPSLSPDRHWLLFVSPDPKNFVTVHTARLLMMSTDGTRLQTLSCGNVLLRGQNKLVWSPDGQQIAFSGPPYNNGSQNWQGKQTLHVLNLRTGQEKLYLTNTSYAPYAWLDNQRLYMIQDTDDAPLTERRTLSLLDTGRGLNQKPENLTPIASTSTVCGDFALSTDRQKIYSTTCSLTRNGCRGVSFHGPTRMNEQSVTGGPGTVLFSRQDLAIVGIQPINTGRVLIAVVDTHAGFTQNGLWEVNTTSGSLNHLFRTPGSECEDPELTNTEAPLIASNSLSYALQVTNPITLQYTLLVGSLSGGVPNTIATRDMMACKCGLTLVGMT
jgi:WD40 repeat protein